MVELGQTWQHGYAERVMRAMKEGKLTCLGEQAILSPIPNLGTLLDKVCNHKRFHSVLDHVQSADVNDQWLGQ